MRINRITTNLFSSFIFKNLVISCFATLCLFYIGASSFFAAPGDLDPTFGTGGKVINSGDARAMTLQTDGKIIVVGFAYVGQFSDFGITRYLPNGSLDAAFGTGGRAGIQVGAGNDYATAVAAQPDGKIVIAGYSETTAGNAFYNFAVVRLNTDGSLDHTFDADGRVITAVNNTRSAAYAVTLQPDGKIVAAGSGGVGNASNFAVVRYNGDGSLDATFDGDGQVTTPVGAAFDEAGAVKVQTDGKIVAAGQVDVGSLTHWGMVRYNQDGSLDTGFNGNGKLVGSFGSGGGSVRSFDFQADGKIVAAGSGGSGNVSGFALLRLTPTGMLDTTFDGDGIVITPVRLRSGAVSVNIQSNGKIVAAGTSAANATTASTDFTILRYNANGALDAGFGSNGIVMTDVTGEYESAISSVLQADGKIVVAGEKTNGQVLARYLGDPIVPRRAAFDFDGDGRTDYGVFRPSSSVWYLLGSQSGFSATTFGVMSDKTVPADFDGDRQTDLAVYRSGVWYLLRSTLGFAAVTFGAAAGDVAVPLDFDGDGKAEIAVFRPSTGVWYLLNLANNQFSAVSFGTAGDRAVPADFDGDGRADLAVYRPSNGVWYLLQSTAGFAAVSFGIAADTPVAADFDGDGKADQSVFRAGIWYLNRTSAGFAAVSFGVSFDKPAVGDYDGDGKVDIAVWRPSSGVFYALLSGSGNQFAATAFGQNGDLPLAASFVP